MTDISSLRPSPIAGTWYPGNPQNLARSVDEYINHAELPELPGRLVAVISPHAGHIYSGPVAGYAFAAVRMEAMRRVASGEGIDLVAVISPMHHPYRDPLLTTAHDAYETPLGELPVDKEALAALDGAIRSRLGHGLAAVAYDQEHSLEIELPFLQRAIPGDFKLLPVMILDQVPKTALGLGDALAEVLKDKRALLVASTDLSHFYDRNTARTLDDEMMRCFKTFSPEEIFQAERTGRGQACGFAAVATVLQAAKALGADRVRLLHYATSGDVTGDHSSVVGYGAAAVLRSEPEE